MTASQEVIMPKIEGAPGLTWRKTKYGWEARWRCRTDLAKRGYRPRVFRLWASSKEQPEMDDFDIRWVRNRCEALQSEMLTWARGGLPAEEFSGTVASLIRAYQTDPDSPYKKLRYNTRQAYDWSCKAIIRDIGDRRITELTTRELVRWHEKYLSEGKVAGGHNYVGMLRTVATFGATFLENDDCQKLRFRLTTRFKAPKPRTERLTAQQVFAIRKAAHAAGRPSIALAQALQFELTLRQKDVIGEWVPIHEPGLSAITNGNSKWLRGLDWKEVDANWIVTHITSKRQKEITVDLKLAPMVMDELGLVRSRHPATGPMVVDERKGLPFTAPDFRRAWRQTANSAGVPPHIRNMDTRAGAISEATDSGASLEKVRKAATHSDIGMTQKYSRGDTEAIAEVMQLRVSRRKTNQDPT